MTANTGVTTGQFQTSLQPFFNRATNPTLNPWANFVVSGTIYFPSTYTSSVFWLVGLGGSSFPAGPNFGIGINYSNPTGISIGDNYAGGNWVTGVVAPLPSPNSTHSYYLFFTYDGWYAYWDGQLIYQNLTPNGTGYFWNSSDHHPVSGSLPLTGMVATISLGTPAKNWISADTSCQITDSTIAYTNSATPVSYVSSAQSYTFCSFNCTMNTDIGYSTSPPGYAQFIGIQSTPTGQDFGFSYYTDGHIWTVNAGTLVTDLGAVTLGTPIQLTIELSSGAVVWYMNGLVVYVQPSIPATYNATFQLQGNGYIWITNQSFNYFRGSTSLPLWASWNNNTGLTGNWYNNSGTSIDFSAPAGGYAYLDPTSMYSNPASNFVLTEPVTSGRMVVPASGLWSMSWTLDGLAPWSGIVPFISINDGNADDITNYTTLAVSTTYNNTTSLSCTARLLTTDYFCIGIYFAGTGIGGTPSQVCGSFTMNYVCSTQ